MIERLRGFLPPEIGLIELESSIRRASRNPARAYELLSEDARRLPFMLSPSDFSGLFQSIEGQEAISASELPRKMLKECRKRFRSDVFPEFSASLYLFIHRLAQRLIQDGVRDVFFLSREGHFLKILFEDYLERKGISSISAHYLKVSRRATYAASLSSTEGDDFQRILNQYSSTSLFELLRSLNFKCEDIEELKAEFDFDFSERLEGIAGTPQFQQLKASPLFRSFLKKTRDEQRELIHRYLESFGVDLKSRPLALVDVGWKGSIQDNLFEIFDKKLPITGYYLGITEATIYHPLLKKVPVIFSMPEASKYRQAFNEHRPLFEIFLGAPHGSVECYIEQGGQAVPHCCWHEREEALYRSLLEPFQASTREVFSRLDSLVMGSSVSEENLFREIAKMNGRMVFRPKSREVDFFQSLTHFENFGVFEFADYVHPTKIFSSEWFNNIKLMRQNFFLAIQRDIWPALTFRNMNLNILRPLYGIARHTATFYPFHRRRQYKRPISKEVHLAPLKSRIRALDEAIAAQESLLKAREDYRDSLIERERHAG